MTSKEGLNIKPRRSKYFHVSQDFRFRDLEVRPCQTTLPVLQRKTGNFDFEKLAFISRALLCLKHFYNHIEKAFNILIKISSISYPPKNL